MAESETEIVTAEFDPAAIAEAELRDSAGGPYGLGPKGFVPKPYARLVAEGLARARAYFGDDTDLRPGSVMRRIVEMSALDHARSYVHLGELYDAGNVSSARSDALDRRGEELGLPRPFLQADGVIQLEMTIPVPDGGLTIEAGARMLTAGGHHVALRQSARFETGRTQMSVPVRAFYPGPLHNLDPAQPDQTIDSWHPFDSKLDRLRELAAGNGVSAEEAVTLTHTARLLGGETGWPDDRYRTLILNAPRSIWTVEALRTAVLLVPGVEEAQIVDEFGGLDTEQSIFGNFNFIERLFAGQRDLGSPYSFRVVVKPSVAAIWTGADGLRASIAEALEDIRPIGIFPDIVPANEVGVGIVAKLSVTGEPLPRGDRASVNASEAALQFKTRLLQRVRAYVGNLGFGEPVRASQVSWAMLNEPGLADVLDLRLARALPPTSEMDFGNAITTNSVRDAALMECGENVPIGRDQVAVFLDDPSGLTIL